jgi:hypothetical protein
MPTPQEQLRQTQSGICQVSVKVIEIGYKLDYHKGTSPPPLKKAVYVRIGRRCKLLSKTECHYMSFNAIKRH